MRENTELLTSTANWERVFNELLTRHIPVLIILMVMAGSTMSQSQIPKKMIDSLKESEFVFVIPTSHEKLVALQNQSESATNSRLRKRQQALFLAEKMNQDSFETALRKAVQQHFSFARYSFLHDTALGPLTAAHVNETTPSFLVMRSYAESGAEALGLFDMDRQPLSRPIPYYARITRITSFIDAFFGASTYPWRDLDAVIARWSDRLQRFYESQ